MVVMPTFAQRKQGQPQAVARFIIGFVALVSKLVHDGIDGIFDDVINIDGITEGKY